MTSGVRAVPLGVGVALTICTIGKAMPRRRVCKPRLMLCSRLRNNARQPARDYRGSADQASLRTDRRPRPLTLPLSPHLCNSAPAAYRLTIPCHHCIVSSKFPILPLPSSHKHVMAIPSSSGPSTPDLSEILDRLGLNSYTAVLSEHGFCDWATVVDITEDDFSTLKFKLGHRRALQREIATFRGIPQSLSLNSDKFSPEPTSLSTSALETLARQTSTPQSREKRRYRRHPRPDPSAPKKPKTACKITVIILPRAHLTITRRELCR
jgi:hypothetical protein